MELNISHGKSEKNYLHINIIKYSHLYFSNFQLNDILKCSHIVEHFASEENIICKLLLTKWLVIQEITKVLKVMYQATIVLQKADFTLSDVYATIVLVEMKLEKYSKKLHVTSLAKHLLNSLVDRKKQIIENPAMMCAILLDPRFNCDLTPQQIESSTNLLTNLWEKIKMYAGKREMDVTSNNKENDDNDSSDDDDIDIRKTTVLNEYKKKKTAKAKSVFQSSAKDVEDSLQNFISSEHKMPSFTIIDFWKNMKTKFPELYQIASIIYAIAPTQVAVERSFSTLSYVFNKLRSQLSEDMLEAILTICLNQDLFEKVNQDNIDELRLEEKALNNT